MRSGARKGDYSYTRTRQRRRGGGTGARVREPGRGEGAGGIRGSVEETRSKPTGPAQEAQGSGRARAEGEDKGREDGAEDTIEAGAKGRRLSGARRGGTGDSSSLAEVRERHGGLLTLWTCSPTGLARSTNPSWDRTYDDARLSAQPGQDRTGRAGQSGKVLAARAGSCSGCRWVERGGRGEGCPRSVGNGQGTDAGAGLGWAGLGCLESVR